MATSGKIRLQEGTVPTTPPSGHGEIWFDDSTSPGVFKALKDDGSTVSIESVAGSDADAIHDNIAGEIALITEKASPVSADLIIIEDSAAANVKKRVQLGNIPLPATVVETDQSNTYTTGTQDFQSATDVDVKDTAFEIHDNLDPTKSFRFQAEAITPGVPKTYTMPDTDGVVVLEEATQDLDNKTLVAPIFTGVVNASGATSLTLPVAAGAAPTVSGQIAYDDTAKQLEYGDDGVNRVVANLDEAQTFTNKTLTSPTLTTPVLGTPSSGTLTSCTGLPIDAGTTGTLPIARGGTGQTTETAAFDALSPTTTKGDIIVSNGTDNIRLAVGTDTHVLTADSAQASGVKWAAVTGGSGDSVSTNSSAATDADFDDATPAAPSGGTNVKWQASGASPTNISAYVPWGTNVIEALRRKPFFYTDFLANLSTGPAQGAWIWNALSGTNTIPTAASSHHPGQSRITAAAGASTGGEWSGGGAVTMVLGGGECYECIFNITTLSNTTIRIGYREPGTADATDGVYIEIPSSGALVGKTAAAGSRTSTDTSFTVSTGTWYRARIICNSDLTRADFYVFTDDGTQQWTDDVQATMPTAVTGHGVTAASSTSVVIVDIDWIAMWVDARALTR